MHSNIKLHLAAVPSEAHTLPTNFNGSAMPLRMAEIQKYGIEEGFILSQSINHYLAHIEMFEYQASRPCQLNFSITKPTFLLCANQYSNACYLCYRPAGYYQKTIKAGKHRCLLITFRADWLLHKSRHVPGLATLAEHYLEGSSQAANLPAFDIGQKLFKYLQKADDRMGDWNTDTAGYMFINESIKCYSHKLSTYNQPPEYHKQKIAELVEFIKLNFGTALVDHVPSIARMLLVSERTLARLAKSAFGIPLHEQVISTRMIFARNQLAITNKPIYEIAALSGYTDPHYFSKAFKRYHGCSPKCVKRPSKELLMGVV